MCKCQAGVRVWSSLVTLERTGKFRGDATEISRINEKMTARFFKRKVLTVDCYYVDCYYIIEFICSNYSPPVEKKDYYWTSLL